MPMFQAVVYAIVGALFEFIPVPPDALYRMISEAASWKAPILPLRGIIELGLFLALLVTFRHDILSLVSSFLQVVLLRRKPRSIDEQIPLLVLAAVALPALLYFTLHQRISPLAPLPFLLVFALFGFIPWFIETRSKRNRNHYDWNLLDSVLVGLGSAFFLLPAVGRTSGAYLMSTARNYSKDGATKFILFVATPMLGAAAWRNLSGVDFHSFAPLEEMSWLTFCVSGVVAFVTGMFAARGVQFQMGRVSLRRYAFLRLFFAILFIGALYLQGALGTFFEG